MGSSFHSEQYAPFPPAHLVSTDSDSDARYLYANVKGKLMPSASSSLLSSICYRKFYLLLAVFCVKMLSGGVFVLLSVEVQLSKL
jgi:hypothetical protein